MIAACKAFLTLRLKEILLESGLSAYNDDNIFFGNMARDFLKTNEYAANCMIFSDEKKKDGKIVSHVRNEVCTEYTYTRRRFKKDVLFRCFLHAKRFEDLWGSPGFIGLVDQFAQKITEAERVIPDSNNNAIRVELHDAVRPWNTDDVNDRVRRLPHKAIVRVEFSGGVYASWTVPIVPDVTITTEVQ
jgi:hypothetical protein